MRSNLSFTVLSLFVMAVFSTPSKAQWTSADGPYQSNYVYSMARYDSMLIAISSSGIFTKTDSSGIWEKRSNEEFYEHEIHDDTLFLRGYSGRVAFVDLKSSPFTVNNTMMYMAKAIVKEGPYILIAHQMEGFEYSTDGGATFRIFNTGLPSTSSNYIWGTDVEAGGNRIFLVTGGDVYQSDFSFTSWSPTGSGLGTGIFKGLEKVGTDLYAFTSDSLFVSHNWGNSWSFLSGAPGEISHIVAYKGDLYLSCRNKGIFRSTNNGQSWIPLNQGMKTSGNDFLGVIDGKLYTASYWGGEFMELDAVIPWKPIDAEGMASTWINDMEKYYNHLYVVDRWAGILRKKPGERWKNITPQTSSRYTYGGLEIAGGVIYVSAVKVRPDGRADTCSIIYSQDGGNHWKSFENILPYMGSIQPPELKYDGRGGLFIMGSSTFHTSDLGKTYTSGPCASDIVNYKNSLLMLHCNSRMISEWLNGQWQFKTLLNIMDARNFLPFDSALFVSSPNGFLVSYDKGQSWQSAPQVPGGGVLGGYARRYNYLFMADESGVYYSGDVGQTWTGLDPLPVFGILGLEIVGDTLYAATYSDGVYQYTLPQSIVSVFETKVASKPYRLFPNPASGSCRLEVNSGQPANYSIYTSEARLLRSGETDANVIDLRDLSSGLYIITIEIDNNLYSEKLVIE